MTIVRFTAFALAFSSLLAASAHAALVHRYSFSGNVNDSVGSADGTIIDAGGTPNFVFAGGQLDLSANTGERSAAIMQDAYVDLPNFLISSVAATNGAVTFEFWATVSQTHTWQRFGDFGTSDGGEDASPGGGNSDYILITPNSGRFGDGLEMTNHNGGGGEPNVGLTGPFATGVEAHVVAVYNHNDTTAGPNGTMTLYLDGTLLGTNLIDPGVDLRTLTDNNNWLGRSQYPDPVFDGSYNEFRIHNNALSAADVAASFATGPDLVVPEPAGFALVGLAGVALLIRRRR